MALESKVLFSRKMAEYGIKEGTAQKMANAGWSTLGAFAFACSAMPNSDGGSGAFEKEIATKLLGADGPDNPRPELAGLRRLHFEAWMTATADLKHRLERKDDDPPRRLPAIEREERKAELAKTLGEGLKLTGEYEPSDALIDLAVEICEGEVVKRIPWERCTAKQAEVEGDKQVQCLREDRDGFIKLATSTSSPAADTSSLLKLSDALLRRGAALEIGRVVSWKTHQKLVAEIMSALKREPHAGMTRITPEQAKAYDVEVWRRTAELAGGRVKPEADGTKPLDRLLEQAMVEPRVAMLLMPRPTSTGASSSSGDTARTKQLENQLAQLKQQMANMKRSQPDSSKGGGKSGGKGKGGKGKEESKKFRGNTARIPGLEGMPTRTSRGKPLCFGYNLGTCQDAAPGKVCSKGLHVCGGCGNAGCTWPNCSSKGRFQ